MDAKWMRFMERQDFERILKKVEEELAQDEEAEEQAAQGEEASEN